VNLSTHSPSGRAWLDVNLAALMANARAVLDQSAGAKLLPMVKANAYGLGAVSCARALEALDPWGFGVATLAEGAELRAAGITRPIVVFTPATADLLPAYRRDDFRAVLDRPEVIAVWDWPFHLELDTGMSRCGVRWDDTAALAACGSPHLEAVFTHFASADIDPRSVETQWQRFVEARRRVPGKVLVHAANSAATWRLPERLDLVRPGIYLYGGSAGPDLPPPMPVASLRAPVVALRRLQPNDPVSYGGDWRAAAATWIATVAAGYADGIPRAVKGKASVLLGGRHRPIVGRITMDFVMVDAGPDGGGVTLGDVATVFGDEPGGATVDEFGAWAGTNAYEILARIGYRVERRYRDGGSAGAREGVSR
jgi:alanine racemase